MRTEEQIKQGYFWLPSNKEKHFSGTLKIYDGGKIELEVIGFLDDNIIIEFEKQSNPNFNGTYDFGKTYKIPRIIGLIDGGYVTLEQCSSPGFGFCIPGISKATIHAQYVFFELFEDSNQIKFNKFQFSVDGIDEWVRVSGITKSVKLHNDNKLASAIIKYIPVKEPIYQLNNGMTFQIVFGTSIPTRFSTESKITQKAYFTLEAESERTLNEFIAVATKIASFIIFATNQVVSIKDVTVSSNSLLRNIDNKTTPISIKCVYQSTTYSKKIPKVEDYAVLFYYTDIKSNFEEVINNWLNNFEIVFPAMALYFSFKKEEQKYLEDQFLALAQGLETYHRRKSSEKLRDADEFEKLKLTIINACPEHERKWLENMLEHGNEINLRKRLKRIIEPFKQLLGNCNQRDELIGKIVDTRNYLTHYVIELESKSVKDIKLFQLCLKMELIFQLSFLNDLGFSQEQITTLYQTKLKQGLLSYD